MALACLVPVALGDTLVLYDGRRIPGKVSQSGDVYIVATRFGTTIEVKSQEVKEWIKGDSAPAAPVSSSANRPATKAVIPSPVPAVSPTSAATVRPGNPRPAAGDSKTVETLVKQGQEALLAKEYKTARDSFHDAATADPRNVRALHGMGLTLIFLGDFKQAGVYMDRAINASQGRPDRALSLNAAMVQIALNNPMRGVKLIRDYLEPRSRVPDEPMLNALGSALFLADENARKSPMWTSSVDFFVRYQNVVEAARPGMKRWGIEWLPAADVEARIKDMKERDAAAGKVLQELEEAESRVVVAKRQLKQIQAERTRGTATPADVNAAQTNLTEKLTDYNKIARSYDEAMDAIVRPTWPRVLAPVALDDVTPPAGEAGSVVMNDPAVKEAIAKAGAAGPAKRAMSEPGEEKSKSATATPPPPPPVIALRSGRAGSRVRVTQYAAAFAVSPELIVTAAASLENVLEFELQDQGGGALRADIVRRDEQTGLALLRVSGKPLPYVGISKTPFAGGAVNCVCLPQASLFSPSPEVVAGTAAAPQAGAWTVKLAKHPRLTASPLIAGNKVVGVVMAGRDDAQDSLPAVTLDALKSILAGQELGPEAGGAKEPTMALLQLTSVRESSINPNPAPTE